MVSFFIFIFWVNTRGSRLRTEGVEKQIAKNSFIWSGVFLTFPKSNITNFSDINNYYRPIGMFHIYY